MFAYCHSKDKTTPGVKGPSVTTLPLLEPACVLTGVVLTVPASAASRSCFYQTQIVPKHS